MEVFLSKSKEIIVTLERQDCYLLLKEQETLQGCYNYLNNIYLSVSDVQVVEFKENGDFIFQLLEKQIPLDAFYPSSIELPKNNKGIKCLVMKCTDRVTEAYLNRKSKKTESTEKFVVSFSPNYKRIKKFLNKRSLI